MLITLLTVVIYIAAAVEILVVTAAVLLTIDCAWWLYKGWRDAAPDKKHQAKHARQARIREEKERSAREGFYVESSVTAFDPFGVPVHRLVFVPSKEAQIYYKAMDRLADEKIFQNTEEL
jgi:ABC-type nickel/cobalt efflux system permease component RcnA